jgi:hypothetical protein
VAYDALIKIKHVQMTTDTIKKATLGANGSLDAVAYYTKDSDVCVK